jgi:hypothetical protein
MTDIEDRTERYYLLMSDDGRHLVSTDMQAGTMLAGPVEASNWRDARQLLEEQIRHHVRQQETDDIPAALRKTDPVFKSAHEALTFAFRFAGQHSPKTPMSVMVGGELGGLGSGRGLSGLDGAGQAGMVLAALRHLDPEQRHVLVARYGDIRRPCPCCGQAAPEPAWSEAVEALSLCDELRELPKVVRHAAIEKVVCRRKLKFSGFVTEYGLAKSTLFDKTRKVKERLGKVENSAMAWLSDFYGARGVLIKEG